MDIEWYYDSTAERTITTDAMPLYNDKGDLDPVHYALRKTSDPNINNV